MHERTALCAREDGFVEVELVSSLPVAHDKTAAGSAKSLVCSSRYDISYSDGALMHTRGNKACDMRDIYHHICSDLVSDLSDALKINSSGICARTCKDHLRLTLKSDLFHLIIIYKTVGINAVMNTVKIFTGDIYR